MGTWIMDEKERGVYHKKPRAWKLENPHPHSCKLCRHLLPSRFKGMGHIPYCPEKNKMFTKIAIYYPQYCEEFSKNGKDNLLIYKRR